jgi:ADP-heptose:LPS heptosyltransferase
VALIERTDGRPRLLVLRALGLGDFLTGVPALRALRRACPEHELVLAAPRALEPLVGLAGVADQLLHTPTLEPLRWSGPPPELAVNLHGRGPQSHEVLAKVGHRQIAAFGCEKAEHVGPTWREDEHEVRRWCRMLEESLGVDTDPRDLGLAPPVTPAAAREALVIHPGAAYPSRRWPPERFAEVARWAVAEGHSVVLTGGPDEVDLADHVRVSAGLRAEALLAGRTSLLELAAQISAARLVVCGDTGVAHLATAFGTPSVLLFGPTAPSRWGPPQDPRHVVIWHGDGTGDPSGEQVDPALMAVEVEEVLSAAGRLLGVPVSQSSPARRTTPASA